jgi:hypothetical protein
MVHRAAVIAAFAEEARRSVEDSLPLQRSDFSFEAGAFGANGRDPFLKSAYNAAPPSTSMI